VTPEQGAIQAELLAHVLKLARTRVLPDDQGGWVAGGQVEEHERDQEHADEDRETAEDSSEDVAGQPVGFRCVWDTRSRGTPVAAFRGMYDIAAAGTLKAGWDGPRHREGSGARRAACLAVLSWFCMVP
jgi:hypothetical protein